MDDNFRDVDLTRIVDAARLKVSKIPMRAAALVGVVVVALVTLAGTVYQIEPEEVGVILRFGKFARTENPGLHIKVPFIENMTRVPVQRQLKQEFGFRTIEAGVRTQFAAQDQRLPTKR